MHKWLIGTAVALAGIGFLLIYGAIKVAAEMVEILAYVAFGIAFVALIGGIYLGRKVSRSLSNH